jgi:hypothetical protein
MREAELGVAFDRNGSVYRSMYANSSDDSDVSRINENHHHHHHRLLQHQQERQQYMPRDMPYIAKFRKQTLTESTSMVHSPIESLLHPEDMVGRYAGHGIDSTIASDDAQSPKSPVRVMQCPVKRGQALFVPSFWWHEVHSKPGDPRQYEPKLSHDYTAHQTKYQDKHTNKYANRHTNIYTYKHTNKDDEEDSERAGSSDDGERNADDKSCKGLSTHTCTRVRPHTDDDMIRLNVALNYWFAPLFDKQFPCAECRKHLNPLYNDVVSRIYRGLL